jgi:hypothetical protein
MIPTQVIKLDHDFGTAVSGVLTDSQARVLALWGSYSEQAGTLAPWHTCSLSPFVSGRHAPCWRPSERCYAASRLSACFDTLEFAEQIHKEEHEWVAGTAARTFAPWVSRVLAAMQPQRSAAPDKQLASHADISVRVRCL